MKKIIVGIVGLLFLNAASALVFPLTSPDNNVVGSIQVVYSKSGDTVSLIGMRYDVGRDAIRVVNPQFNPEKPLPAGVPIIVPSKFIVPPFAHNGFIINLAEMRMYYFPPGQNQVFIYPIGIGKAGAMTPLGSLYVVRKTKDPTWIPPESIREFNRKNGIILPKVIQGGPDNPLGRRAIYMSAPSYLIHATNYPASVGSRGSFGCIRMTETDIDQLYPHVALNTPIMVIEQPYLAGWYNGQLYFEANKPLNESRFELNNLVTPALEALVELSFKYHVDIDWKKVEYAIQSQTGIPTVVSEPMEGEDNNASDDVATLFTYTSPGLMWPKNTALCKYSHACQS
jgi:L,D-transpeptidase ErfK/SrfK